MCSRGSRQVKCSKLLGLVSLPVVLVTSPGIYCGSLCLLVGSLGWFVRSLVRIRPPAPAAMAGRRRAGVRQASGRLYALLVEVAPYKRFLPAR